MPASAAMRAFAWGDGVQVAAQDLRLGQLAALLSALGGSSTNQLAVGSGVRDGVSNPLQTNVASGLSVTVNPGFAAVQGSAAANSGAYSCTLDAAATLTCATADLVNPRIDSVVVQVVDNGNATSTATVNIQTGTPASSPTPPPLPANALLLCNITVPANATSLTSGNLSDQRSFLAVAGGVKPVLGPSFYPATGTGSASSYAHDMSVGRLKWFNGTALQAPKTAAFAPITATSVLLATANSVTAVTVVSTGVTVDGVTQVKITVNIPSLGVPSPTAVGNAFNLTIVRGATTVFGTQAVCSQTSNRTLDGRSLVAFDVPPAGSPTYLFQIATQGGGMITAPVGTTITVEATSS